MKVQHDRCPVCGKMHIVTYSNLPENYPDAPPQICDRCYRKRAKPYTEADPTPYDYAADSVPEL